MAPEPEGVQEAQASDAASAAMRHALHLEEDAAAGDGDGDGSEVEGEALVGGAVWRCWVRRVGRGKPVRLTLHVPCRVEWRVAAGSWRATTVMFDVTGMWTGGGVW